MRLYTYKAEDAMVVYGMIENEFGMPTRTNTSEIISIGQRPDYSNYLVLSDTKHELMEAFDGNYDGWDFNYRQEWGLAINDEVVERVLKDIRTEKLNTIVVDINGKLFDGNEKSRNNMMSAILSSDLTTESETPWKLADNSIALVNLNDVKLALDASIRKTGEILFSVVFEK